MLDFDEEEFICVMTEYDSKGNSSGCLPPVMVLIVILLVFGFLAIL